MSKTPQGKVFLPTASYSELLLNCTWPFGRDDLPTPPISDAAAYGTEFHAALADMIQAPAIVENLKRKESIAEVKASAVAAAEVLFDFLKSNNTALTDCKVELPVAYNPIDCTARFCKPHDENHNYTDRRDGEICGTADLAANLGNRVFILDHKTGYDLPAVDTNPQLLTLALALSTIWAPPGGDLLPATVAILHAPRGGPMPMIYTAEISAAELRLHADKLLHSFSDIDSGSLRPGSHCQYCPANTICPAQGGPLLNAIAKAAKSPVFSPEKVRLDLTTPEGKGDAHQLYQILGNIHKTIGEQLRQSVADTGPGVRRDGKTVQLVPVTRRQLSQASILRQLGTEAGNRKIAELDAAGCIETVTRTELRACVE